MLWLLVTVLLVLWLLGWVVFEIAEVAIHLLLIIALVVIVWNFVSGRT